jgi:EAL domain-containing protein (putative c-di-GMP-specific phosphodiesterase class I)
VETKIGHDPKVVLQALDYWIWVQPNEDAVRATRNALDQLKEWVASGLRLPVSVNVDAMSLLDSEFPDRVAALLTGSGVPADLLTLEITETAFISDGDRALTVLNRLRQMGVRLALDDFGTGTPRWRTSSRCPCTS